LVERKSEDRDKWKNIFAKDGTDFHIPLQAHKYRLYGKRGIGNQEEDESRCNSIRAGIGDSLNP
jgi:hypothetical protein